MFLLLVCVALIHFLKKLLPTYELSRIGHGEEDISFIYSWGVTSVFTIGYNSDPHLSWLDTFSKINYSIKFLLPTLQFVAFVGKFIQKYYSIYKIKCKASKR